MMEKANRLGEQFTLKNKPTDGVDKMYANAISKGPNNTRSRNSYSMAMRTEDDQPQRSVFDSFKNLTGQQRQDARRQTLESLK